MYYSCEMFSLNQKSMSVLSVLSVLGVLCLPLLGTDERSLRGLSTLKALRAFTSNPSIFNVDSTVLTTLELKIINVEKIYI